MFLKAVVLVAPIAVNGPPDVLARRTWYDDAPVAARQVRSISDCETPVATRLVGDAGIVTADTSAELADATDPLRD